jgi:hypothetical protein
MSIVTPRANLVREKLECFSMRTSLHPDSGKLAALHQLHHSLRFAEDCCFPEDKYLRCFDTLTNLGASFVKLKAALGAAHAVVRLGLEEVGQLTSNGNQITLTEPTIDQMNGLRWRYDDITRSVSIEQLHKTDVIALGVGGHPRDLAETGSSRRRL